ncbi:MAG: hypothetical protein AAGC93_30710 [Cyanobacteria bacterium P01_F01_bin.53]
MSCQSQVPHITQLTWKRALHTKHRAFVEAVEQHSTLREFVQKHQAQTPYLKALYNDCMALIGQFRSQHLEFAAHYIHQQTAKGHNNTDIGAGGTPFMKYLKKHRDETRQHRLK